jgi:hypothetical protein
VSYFAQIIICDFEFEAADGGRLNPICMVARELLGAKREWRVWEGEFGALPPFDISENTLFVSYNAAAEMGCFLALCWPMSARGVDCLVEYRVLINETRPKLPNGQTSPSPPAGFEHALSAYGFTHASSAIKAVRKTRAATSSAASIGTTPRRAGGHGENAVTRASHSS